MNYKDAMRYLHQSSVTGETAEEYWKIKNEYMASNGFMMTSSGAILDPLGHIVLSPDQEDRIAEKVTKMLISEFRSPTVNTTYERTRQEIERQMQNLRVGKPHMHSAAVDAIKANEAMTLEEKQKACEHEWITKFTEPSHLTCVKCGVRG